MRKVMIKLILAINVIVWIILSFINYVGIMQQLNNDMIRIFIWSIFIVMVYGVIIYSLTLEIKRVLLLYLYRGYKVKYISNRAFIKQNILLGVAILYVFGACYYSSDFLGLIPMLLFFSKSLINMGRFYVWDNEHLIMAEDISKEYQVISFNPNEKKLSVREIDTKTHNTIEAVYQMEEEEIKFLTGVFEKAFDKMEVA